MSEKINGKYYNICLKNGFLPDDENTKYCSAGKTLRVDNAAGHGTYWIYEAGDLFSIRIHDFYFNQTQTMTFRFYDCTSITKYDEISGTELPSGRKLTSGCIKSFIGGKEHPYSVEIPAKKRISSIGIEILPAFYNKYLKDLNPDEYKNITKAFHSVDQTDDFPEMSALLSEIKAFRGEGLAAQLFYNAKVSEAMSLLANYQKSTVHNLSQNDKEHIRTVTMYIDENYTKSITIKDLEKLAYMGTTKLQKSFRQYHGCTITTYIQHKRIEKAKELLKNTSMPVNEIAAETGYKKASHFSEIFKKTTGILPLKYRKSHSGKC